MNKLQRSTIEEVVNRLRTLEERLTKEWQIDQGELRGKLIANRILLSAALHMERDSL